MSDELYPGNVVREGPERECCGASGRAESSFAAPAGSVSAEQWWTHHAELIAAKMKCGGVKSFRIELTPRGTYAFEVVPTAETPNVPISGD